ncbi:fused MFS/spermidine synthase [Pseudonocardia sp. WMMC193]|uniref:fused MFS/spermidine synthase n=1 Tax=Pseudonocardia sp. WMMC193 TaxID=2911965 RepID=UPI001F1ADDA0|nr:fused MFS/spermidine synthase [Pseudonocardia sp. WMMC193]MCF7552712.1 fused MFS/spermidine synthase [Pseudonocardia sp. WMMC193]
MRPSLARVAALGSGAVILVVETLATRLVAPYVGLTLESTTAAIGVALAGIAAGAALGGRLSDWRDPRAVAALGMLLGGLGVLAVQPVVRVVGPVVGPGPAATIVLVGASTMPAIIALSLVAPAVTKAMLHGMDGAGTVIGLLSAAGTIGSLAGTFAAGFVLVALLPVSVILYICSGVCLALAWWLAASWPRGVVLRAGAAVVVLAGLTAAVPGRCDADTTYYCARVEPGAGPTDRVLVLDDLRHSAVDLADPAHLEFAYTRRFADAVDAAFPAGAALGAVHVGGGGYSLPRWLAATRPDSRSTVLELDAGVVDLVGRELGAAEIPGVETRVGDARTTLAGLPADSADLVVGDAFGARSVPWHLATREFVTDVDRVLRADGIYVLNVIDQYPHSLLWSVTATVAERFSQVQVLVRPDQLGRGQGGNAVVVASHRPLDTAALERAVAARGEPGSVLPGPELDARLVDRMILTDDFAPTDQLAARARFG